MTSPRVGVVGHVEWVEFAVVDHVPVPGEIAEALEPPFRAAAGGGGVAAVQLAKLAPGAAFFTSVGDDEAGTLAADFLRDAGVELHAAVQDLPQRRAWTHLDAAHERTITVLGDRHVPLAADDLPWDELGAFDALFFSGGDVEALRAARAARFLVATPRARGTLEAAGVELDVLVASANDAGEQLAADALDPPPRHVVLTAGAAGGGWTGVDGTTGRWAAVAPPGPPVDAFGCGDSFAAGLTYGLGAGLGLQGALEVAARCGAWCLTGRGPYGRQLSRDEL